MDLIIRSGILGAIYFFGVLGLNLSDDISRAFQSLFHIMVDDYMTNNGKNLSDKRIKVLFTFGGMPHYLKALLRNVQRKGIDIVVTLPDKGKGRSIGAGVYIPDEEYDFKVFYLKECTGWYGKPFLKGLKNLIVQERPDILVLYGLIYCRLFLILSCTKRYESWIYRFFYGKFPFRCHQKGKLRAISGAIPI